MAQRTEQETQQERDDIEAAAYIGLISAATGGIGGIIAAVSYAIIRRWGADADDVAETAEERWARRKAWLDEDARLWGEYYDELQRRRQAGDRTRPEKPKQGWLDGWRRALYAAQAATRAGADAAERARKKWSGARARWADFVDDLAEGRENARRARARGESKWWWNPQPEPERVRHDGDEPVDAEIIPDPQIGPGPFAPPPAARPHPGPESPGPPTRPPATGPADDIRPDSTAIPLNGPDPSTEPDITPALRTSGASGDISNTIKGAEPMTTIVKGGNNGIIGRVSGGANLVGTGSTGQEVTADYIRRLAQQHAEIATQQRQLQDTALAAARHARQMSEAAAANRSTTGVSVLAADVAQQYLLAVRDLTAFGEQLALLADRVDSLWSESLAEAAQQSAIDSSGADGVYHSRVVAPVE